MTRFENFIMTRRGAAAGVITNRHSMTEADQRAYHYVYGP